MPAADIAAVTALAAVIAVAGWHFWSKKKDGKSFAERLGIGE